MDTQCRFSCFYKFSQFIRFHLFLPYLNILLTVFKLTSGYLVFLPEKAAFISEAVLAARIALTRSASILRKGSILLQTSANLSAGNLQAPFSSIWIISPGATSMPATETGTLMALIANSPCPGVTPLIRYWNFMGRISSTSLDGPLVTTPIAPQAWKAVVICPPQSPTLGCISGGKSCLMTTIIGFFDFSKASIKSLNDNRLKFGFGNVYTTVTA